MSIYVIPPYLLNTTLGESLQREVSTQDSALAIRNTVAVSSPYYEATAVVPPLPKNKFSSDPLIHSIIRDKLVSKLGILGVLGVHIKRPEEFSDEELFELFETFKHRLLKDDSKNDDDTNSEAPATKTSYLEDDRYAEVFVTDKPYNIPEKYHKYLSYTLKQLLYISKVESKNTANRPSFIRINDEYFQYPLPSSWISLITNINMTSLNSTFELATKNRNGFPSIELTTRRIESAKVLDAPASRYYNFISNKPVTPATGVFYYEVEIIQTCTEATDFTPLLVINDSSISSHKSPQCCIGFTKRFISYEPRRGSNASSNPVNGNVTKIDLEDLKNELSFNQDTLINKPMSPNVESLLDVKPGELKGSFALDLSDSIFYNSIKGSESAQRTNILNMNRRLSSLSRQNLEELDSGKINMDVPFATSTIENKVQKVVKSDIIGCGINFIEKSLFITLNGILIRTISKEELTASNPASDNLFINGFSDETAVYPIIGFKLNRPELSEADIPSSLVVQTNLGFKDFKFNISNYIGHLKKESEKNLNLSLINQQKLSKSKKLPTSTIEDSLLNVHDDSRLLNSLIRGFLNTEGYIDSLEAMNRDIRDLNDTIEAPGEQVDDTVIIKSHGKNRQSIKNFFSKHQYDDILSLIHSQYGEVFDDPEGQDLIFEIQLQKLVYLLKSYLERKLSFKDDFSFEYEGHEDVNTLYKRVLDYVFLLQHEHKLNDAKSSKIKSVSALLLVKDSKALKNLPAATQELNQLEESREDLCERVNKKILRVLGFDPISNLERIVTNVDKNIQSLSLKHFDNTFALVNFEKDQLEL